MVTAKDHPLRPSPHRCLYLLGGLRVEAAGVRVVIPVGQPALLLARLGLSPRIPHLREQFSDTLWPAAPFERAARYLSNTLYRLRKALGPGWLNAEGGRLGLSPDTWTDVEHFQQLAVSGDPDDWQQGIRVYAGELLPEVYADWVLLARLGARELHLRLLTQLGEWAASNAQWPEAARYFESLAVSDPFNEAAVRGLLRALAALGRTTEALERYERFAAMLDRELAVLPTPPTRQVADDLRREVAVRQAARETGRLPFVGRSAERATPLIARHFAAGRARGQNRAELANDPSCCDVFHLSSWTVERQAGACMIGLVEQAATLGYWGILTFHGIQEGHLPVGNIDFVELLDHLARRRDALWLAPVAEVGAYVTGQQAAAVEG